jgi:hypothetical protein
MTWMAAAASVVTKHPASCTQGRIIPAKNANFTLPAAVNYDELGAGCFSFQFGDYFCVRRRKFRPIRLTHVVAKFIGNGRVHLVGSHGSGNKIHVK